MKFYLTLTICIITIFTSFAEVRAKCHGKFINPITDICWECLFPLTIASSNVTPSYDEQTDYNKYICNCPGTPPIVGIPFSFYEPARLVDVTLEPFCFVGLGGSKIAENHSVNRGSIGKVDGTTQEQSFYHLHWYIYPILSWLELFSDFHCITKENYDIGYISELDPTWNDSQWSQVLNPEAAIFSSPAAHIACTADCVSSSLNKPIDKLFWCGGCQGSLYPFNGHVAHHSGGIQASSLLVERIIAKFHRLGLLLRFEEDDFCKGNYNPLIKKSQYKTQLVYPASDANGICPALGSSSLLWGAGRNYPISGEDFAYLIWRKKQCCLDMVKPSIKAGIGAATGGACPTGGGL